MNLHIMAYNNNNSNHMHTIKMCKVMQLTYRRNTYHRALFIFIHTYVYVRRKKIKKPA